MSSQQHHQDSCPLSRLPEGSKCHYLCLRHIISFNETWDHISFLGESEGVEAVISILIQMMPTTSNTLSFIFRYASSNPLHSNMNFVQIWFYFAAIFRNISHYDPLQGIVIEKDSPSCKAAQKVTTAQCFRQSFHWPTQRSREQCPVLTQAQGSCLFPPGRWKTAPFIGHLQGGQEGLASIVGNHYPRLNTALVLPNKS